MDKKLAIALLESLLDRIELDATSSKWKIGTISANEKESIEYALNYIKDGDPPPSIVDIKNQPTSIPTKSTAPKFELNLQSLDYDEPQDSDVIVCLDFGTAMSKAFAMRGDDELVELALGTLAGSLSGYPVESSLFISDDGNLYFGPQAIAESEKSAETGRMRFDSPKARLSHGLQGEIDRNKVEENINPTNISVTEGDLITLYLAYLTDLATTELENHNLSRYVARRFARPCWDDARNKWAETYLKRMLAQAQILADTFHNQWSKGISLNLAKTAVDEVRASKIPSYLIIEGVPEPVAAAASLMIKRDAQRELFMVIDVGAGTTDFGLFLIQENPSKDLCLVRIIPDTIQYLPQAGDRIDSLLKSFILNASGVDPHGADGKLIATSLQNQIRTYKETLFRDGKLEYQLSNHYIGVVEKEMFLKSDLVNNFSKQLEAKFISILNMVGEGYLGLMHRDKLNVVLTGGGADLPMIESLSSSVQEIRGKRILCKQAPRVPKWVKLNYEQLSPQYPQLAVAIGGANPILPELGKPFKDFGGLPTTTYE